MQGFFRTTSRNEQIRSYIENLKSVYSDMVGKYVIMVLLRRGWNGGNYYSGSDNNDNDKEII